jgi:molecular chaperone GrpE
MKIPVTAAPFTDSHEVPAPAPAVAAEDVLHLQQQIATQKDDYLRLVADFDNFKKRTRRDAEIQAAAEKESFIHDLLPVLDNFERALASESSTTFEQLHQGVEMTLQQLIRLLREHGIEASDEAGLPFDPHRHEALSTRVEPDQPPEIVLQVIQRGYRRGDKVFRPARVIVNAADSSPGS